MKVHLASSLFVGTCAVAAQTRFASCRSSYPLGVTDRTRTDTARLTTSGARRYTTATRNSAGTAGLEPAASRPTSERSALLSYVPGRVATRSMSASRPRPTAFQTGPLRVELPPCKITPAPSTSPRREIDATAQSVFDVSSDRTERCFPSHSPTLRPWIAHRRLRTSEAIDVLRGGALEPDHRTLGGKSACLSTRAFPALFSSAKR
jgi:hypothetical protein